MNADPNTINDPRTDNAIFSVSPVFGNVLEDMVLVELFVAIVFDGVGVSLPPDVLTFV